jgi:O-antigen ligase
VLSLNYRNIIIAGFAVSVITVGLLDYLHYLIAGLLLIFSWKKLAKDYLVPFFIIVFLLITSDIGDSLRNIVNASAIALLAFYFVKYFGFDFGKYPVITAEVKVLLALIFGSMVISAMFSSNLIGSIIWTVRQAVFFLIVFIFYSFIKSERDIGNIINALILASLVLSLAVVYNFFMSSTAVYILQTQGFLSEGGYFGNVAAAGGIFAISIPLTISLLLKRQTDNPFPRTIIWAILIIQLTALLLTNSRAAILAVFFSVLFILFTLNKKHIKYLFATLIFIVAGLLLLFPSIFELVSVYLRFERVFENSRYQLWEIAYRIIEDNWIVGVGPGEFKAYIYKYIPAMIGSWQEQQIAWIYENAGLGHTHNFVLFKFSELGILGLITAFAVPIVFLKTAVDILKITKDRSPNTYILVVCIIGSGIGLFARSFFESTGILSYGWITRDLPFWLLFSILLYYYNRIKNDNI